MAVFAFALLAQPVSTPAQDTSVDVSFTESAYEKTSAPKVDNRLIQWIPGEPKNARQYRKMFGTVPTTEWGGGDVSISTRLSDGRRLWLHGDTLSETNGFVHSTALVQTGSTLRVANGGQQVLPDHEKQPTNGTKNIYWIETVEAWSGSLVLITAAPMNVTPGDPWGFKRFNRKSRQALMYVDADGDTQFIRWVRWVKRPNIGMDGDDVKVLGPNHYSYAVFVHDIRLRSGHFLRTRNQNWDDALENHFNEDGTFRFEDWRPMFEKSKTRSNPYWGR